MGFWPLAKKVLYESDIVLLIIDARMPEMSRNMNLEEQVRRLGKVLVLVFNKIDLISQQALNELKTRHTDAFFVSGNKNIGISNLKSGLYILAKRMKLEEPKIGVVGYPNVGKSSIINAIARRARTQVANYAGTTKGVQWVKVGDLFILDSPGVIPFEDKSTKLAVLGAKNAEKLRVPEKAAYELVNKFILDGKKDKLEKFYGLSLSDDPTKVLLEIGKKRGFLLKAGKIDERRAAIQILRDWQRGKLKV
ncbi:MAG: GTPase [Nanoarchaeota archaeon]|nr:GTPase [Nanoarchaeota archaeon]